MIIKKVKSNEHSNSLPYAIVAEFLEVEKNKLGWSYRSLNKGICDASYLSGLGTKKKKTNEDTLKLLAEKMGVTIPFDDLKMDYESVTKDIILSYFYKRKEELKDLIETEWIIKHENIYNLALVINHIVQRDYKDALEILDRMQINFGVFTKSMQTVYLVAYSEVQCNLHYFNQAIKVSSLLDYYELVDERLIALREKTLFIAKASLHLGFSALSHYHSCSHILQKFHVGHMRSELNLYYAELTSKDDPKTAQAMLDAMVYEEQPKSLYNMHNYVKVALVNTTNKKAMAKRFTRHAFIDKKDLNYYKLLMVRSEANGKPMPFSYKDCPQQLRSMYLMKTYRVHENLEKHKAFLKEIALPAARENQSLSDYNFFTEEVIKCSIAQKRYKEALSYADKRKRLETSLRNFEM